VQFYDLHTRVNPRDSSISGWNGITYRVLQSRARCRSISQVPMEVDSMVQDRRKLTYRRDGNAFFVTLTAQQRAGTMRTITVWYHGKPRVGRRLPWDGGFTFPTDSLGRLWIATANEGLGASVWWPNKELPGRRAGQPAHRHHHTRSADRRLQRAATEYHEESRRYHDVQWFVMSPINNYNVTINAGEYTHFSDTLNGEAERLN